MAESVLLSRLKTRPETERGDPRVFRLDVETDLFLVEDEIGQLPVASVRDVVDSEVMGADGDEVSRAGKGGDVVMAGDADEADRVWSEDGKASIRECRVWEVVRLLRNGVRNRSGRIGVFLILVRVSPSSLLIFVFFSLISRYRLPRRQWGRRLVRSDLSHRWGWRLVAIVGCFLLESSRQRLLPRDRTSGG
jgi:hypothetical protein